MNITYLIILWNFPNFFSLSSGFFFRASPFFYFSTDRCENIKQTWVIIAEIISGELSSRYHSCRTSSYLNESRSGKKCFRADKWTYVSEKNAISIPFLFLWGGGVSHNTHQPMSFDDTSFLNRTENFEIAFWNCSFEGFIENTTPFLDHTSEFLSLSLRSSYHI